MEGRGEGCTEKGERMVRQRERKKEKALEEGESKKPPCFLVFG